MVWKGHPVPTGFESNRLPYFILSFSLDSSFLFRHTCVHEGGSGARPASRGKGSTQSAPTDGGASGLESAAVVPVAMHTVELAQPSRPAEGHGRAELVGEARAAWLDPSAGAAAKAHQPHARSRGGPAPLGSHTTRRLSGRTGNARGARGQCGSSGAPRTASCAGAV